MKFVVNLNSHVIHKKDCHCVENMRNEFKKIYNTYEKAENALDSEDFKCRPCKICRPEK